MNLGQRVKIKSCTDSMSMVGKTGVIAGHMNNATLVIVDNCDFGNGSNQNQWWFMRSDLEIIP